MIGGDRPQYIKEMLIDEVSKEDDYQKESIKRKLETYFELEFRNNKKTNNMLKDYYQSYIGLLDKDREGKMNR